MTCGTRNCQTTPQRYRKYCEKCRTHQWRVKNPIKSAYKNLKRSAAKRSIAFELTIMDFTVFSIETGYVWLLLQGYDVTVDRIRSLEGYKKDNMQILVRCDNTKKARQEFAYGSKYITKGDGVPF